LFLFFFLTFFPSVVVFHAIRIKQNTTLENQSISGGKNMANNKGKKKEEASIEQTIAELMSNEDRKDAEFRFAILTTEIGGVGKYITHDPLLNPGARPYNNKEDEKLAYGQIIVQLMGLAHIRGINYTEALNLGLKNWLDADWRKRKAEDETKVKGLAACPGFAYGEAYVVNSERSIQKLADSKERKIIVMEAADPEFVIAIKNIEGIITDHGGYTCHAANIAREHNVPCIVGTGNATRLIENNQTIRMVSGIDGKSVVGEVYFK
jgi:phosphohistidine swiveling domain-containing protein